MKKHSPYLVLISVLLFLDQLTKFVIGRTLDLYENIQVVPGFAGLTHVQNKGAIFGFLSQSGSPIFRTLLLAASFLALALIVYYFLKASAADRALKIALSLILAGALGNQLDRIIRGYVIDFLDLYIKNWHWPTFNVADSCISIGAVLLIFVFFFKKD